MEGTRAIQGGMTAAESSGPPTEGLDIPRGRPGCGGGGGTISSWLSMLTHHRHHRRESFGFNDSVVTGIEDEDSNSGLSLPEQQKSLPMPRKPSEADLLRSRNVSFSELTSPGGDGDLYFVSQFRRRTSLTQEGGITLEAASTSLQVTKGGVLRLEEREVERNNTGQATTSNNTTSQLLTSKSLTLMEPIREGIPMETAPPAVPVISASAGDGSSRLTQPQPAEMKEESGGLFLIDFEAVEEGNRVKLKPQSRKFGMSALFDSHLAQNWFFRNPHGHEDEEDGHHLTDDEHLDQQHGNEQPHPQGGGVAGLLGRIQQAVTDHPLRLHEMNLAEPQGM